MTDIVERLREAAREIETDGTPSQVGLTATETREAAAEIERLRETLAELGNQASDAIDSDDLNVISDATLTRALLLVSPAANPPQPHKEEGG